VLLSTVTASSAKDLKSSDTIIDFLECIGIINTETDAADDIVTREIFAVYVARMLGIDENSESGTRYFADVENNAFSQKAVNTLVESRIIDVPEDRYFRPGDTVSYNEAVKMLVCAAGYKTYAAYSGGYPEGYLNVAKQLKIECEVQDRSQLKVNEAAKLIYKTLVAPMRNFYETDKIDSEIDSKDSMLAMYFNILWQEGTVSKIAGQSIKSGGVLPIGKAEIDSNIYDISSDIDSERFLGSYVRYFYKDGIDEIIFISDEVKKTEDIIIDIDLLDDFTGSELSYYKNYNTSRIVREKLYNPVVVYNGIYLGENIKNTFDHLNKGSITVKDSDNDGKYDFISVKDYSNFIVGASDAESRKLFNKLSTGRKEIFCEDFDVVTLKDEMGNELEFGDIPNQAAASVAASKDNKSYIEIIVSSTEFNGAIQEISDNEFGPYVVINSERYMIDKSYLDEFSANTSVGNVYYFKTDMFGKIAYVYSDSTRNYSMGYVRKLNYDIDSEKCFLRVLTEKCTVETMTVDDRAKIDGRKYKNMKAVNEALQAALGDDTSVSKRFICYRLNDEGYITEIDTLTMNTSSESGLNSITAVYPKDNTEKVFSYGGAIGNTTRTFGRAALVTPKTTVFLLPGGSGLPDIEDCYVGTYSNILKENIRYTGNAYKLSTMNAYADAVLAWYDAADLDGNTNGSKYAFMIDKISLGVNENEEVVQFISGYENGVKKTLEASKDVDFSGLKRGDVVRFEYDVNKKISKNGVAEKLYDPNDEYPDWEIDFETGCRLKESASYTQVFQISFGNVVRVIDDCVFWAADGYTDIVDSADVSSASITVYDSDKKTISAGTVNDIYDAEAAGENCSKIMYVTRDNAARCIYIFN
jgi:hypothetical protein